MPPPAPDGPAGARHARAARRRTGRAAGSPRAGPAPGDGVAAAGRSPFVRPVPVRSPVVWTVPAGGAGESAPVAAVAGAPPGLMDVEPGPRWAPRRRAVSGSHAGGPRRRQGPLFTPAASRHRNVSSVSGIRPSRKELVKAGVFGQTRGAGRSTVATECARMDLVLTARSVHTSSGMTRRLLQPQEQT